MKLSRALKDKSKFIIVAELTGGPDFSLAPIEKFLNDYKQAGPSSIPASFDFAAITSPQNPGGVANIEPADVLSHLQKKALLGDLDFIPHMTCKDQNANSLISSLALFKRSGIESMLVLTGDKPIGAKGVFELDSIGLLNLIKYTNNQQYIKAKPEELETTFQYCPGAAVSQFKYTEASQMQQYFKMSKKVRSGARFFITQLGWDWKKSEELFRYVKEEAYDVPIIGNVYLLSTLTSAPRLMHDIKLTGCYVSDELLAKVTSVKVADHIERAAQQVAMYKSLGAAGVDIGGLTDFAIFSKILTRAAEIGDNWQQFKSNLCWPSKNPFYLYDDTGKRRPLSAYTKKFKQKFFNFSHRAVMNPEYSGFHAFKKVSSALGLSKEKGAMYKLFNASEKAFKYMLFDCQECGDCYLPENFGLCTIGGCEKGLANPPCGDVTIDGFCGNNLDKECIGEQIYKAASSEKGGLAKLQATINKPRNPALHNTASMLNYIFGRDHTKKNLLISIGEALHGSIPKTGRIMRQLHQLGPDAYTKTSGPLNYIIALIESQVSEGADYLAVNLDAFGEKDPKLTIQMMKLYVHLIQKWGNGVPICIDTSSTDVLITALQEWYGSGLAVREPLLNSVKVYSMDKILPLKGEFDFSFIGMLIGQDKPTGPGGSHSIDELLGFANKIYDEAVGKFGFKPEQILFDSTVFPLAIDMPMSPNVPGYTYRAFETIKKIKSDPKFKGVHCSLGVSNSVRELPGRKIGVCRAYVAKAMEYGLDAAILNTAHRYGSVEPDAELLKLVDAFAKMDGSPERFNEAMKLMSKFCRECRKPAK
jgi:5,10-methylenetetrahydrofolate reductase